MKKLTTLILLLLSPLVTAQEKEIWACQGIFDGKTGFSWENGKWVNSLFNERNMLVTIDGSNSVIKQNGFDYPYACRATTSSIVGALVSCSSNNSLFLLNSGSGQAGWSNLLGAVSPNEGRDSVTVALYNCTKF